MTKTETVKVVIHAWLIAWALAYLATALFAPGIAGDVSTGQILYVVMGLLIIGSLAALRPQNHCVHKIQS